MGKLKTGILSVVGIVVGVVTLRAVRNRRTADPEEEPELSEVAVTEAQAAAEDAKSAVTHARTAGEHAVEYVRGEFESAGLTEPRE